MPLTPTDVANKQFRIAFRGYSLDEVDAFLDEVETELSRLLRDNASLKERSTGAAAAPAPALAAAAPAAAPASPSMEGQEAALRTLLLAQRTADEAIAEARAEAEDIVARARAEADAALESARNEAESTLGSAKEKAARIDQDVAQRIQAATGDLDERRTALESRIEELRSFEREYRTRLQAYLESQLRDLTSGSGPDDGGAGVPAGARSAAVGLTPGGAAGVRQGPAPVPGRGGPGAVPGSHDQGSDGPPREAPAPSTLRAVPPLDAGGEPVGPFTVVPGVQPSGDRGPDAPDGR